MNLNLTANRVFLTQRRITSGSWSCLPASPTSIIYSYLVLSTDADALRDMVSLAWDWIFDGIVLK
jgi:hypothetical protein